MIQPENSIAQIAYMVEDLDAALKHWVEVLGIGPFFLIDTSVIKDTKYRDQAMEVDIHVALSYSGSVCVELIQQLDETPSVYKEVMDKRGPGFHHWGVMTENYEQDIARYEKRGHANIYNGHVTIGGRFAFMDTLDDLNGVIELIELTPVVKDLFTGLQSATKDWDGTDPVRRA